MGSLDRKRRHQTLETLRQRLTYLSNISGHYYIYSDGKEIEHISAAVVRNIATQALALLDSERYIHSGEVR